MSLKTSITKSRSGHYSVAIKSSDFGRLFIARKVSSLGHARNILKEATAKLLTGEGFRLEYNCLYSVNITALSKYAARFS